MSRSLISVVQTFEGCNDNFLDSLSVLCHEVSVGCLLLGSMLPGQCCISKLLVVAMPPSAMSKLMLYTHVMSFHDVAGSLRFLAVRRDGV